MASSQIAVLMKIRYRAG